MIARLFAIGLAGLLPLGCSSFQEEGIPQGVRSSLSECTFTIENVPVEEGGEDVKFIARRLLISAAEDIGLANPNALLLANNCFQAVNIIGLPEARIILSEATIYLACSPKSNSAYAAIKQAQKTVRETGNLPVPLSLRNSPTRLMKDLGYGKNYKYAHDFDGNFADHNFLPDELEGKKWYEPQDNPQEKTLRERLQRWWKNRYKY